MTHRTDALERDLPPRWATTEQVLAHLGDIGRDTLRSLMADSERAGLTPVWVDYARGAAARWRWDARPLLGEHAGKLAVDLWFEQVCGWRAATKRARARGSAGATPTTPPRSRPAGTESRGGRSGRGSSVGNGLPSTLLRSHPRRGPGAAASPTDDLPDSLTPQEET